MTNLQKNDPDPVRLLFVCLGNICRSPLAEGVFLHLAEEAGLASRYRADSAGTGGWHSGEFPDSRSIEVAERNGVRLQGRARQVRDEDFHEFDLVIAMDRENLRHLERLKEASDGHARLVLLREFDPEATEDLEVPDPYYRGGDGFDQVFEMVQRSCTVLLESLEANEPDSSTTF